MQRKITGHMKQVKDEKAQRIKMEVNTAKKEKACLKVKEIMDEVAHLLQNGKATLGD